jgi:hypothetical protein
LKFSIYPKPETPAENGRKLHFENALPFARCIYAHTHTHNTTQHNTHITTHTHTRHCISKKPCPWPPSTRLVPPGVSGVSAPTATAAETLNLKSLTLNSNLSPYLSLLCLSGCCCRRCYLEYLRRKHERLRSSLAALSQGPVPEAGQRGTGGGGGGVGGGAGGTLPLHPHLATHSAEQIEEWRQLRECSYVIHACMDIYIHIQIHTHTHTHARTHAQTHTHAHTHMYICMYMYIISHVGCSLQLMEKAFQAQD